MRVQATDVPDVVVIDPEVHSDARGFLLETYHEPRYAECGISDRFVQDNHSRSSRHTLRGLHAQSPNPQGKLVRCVEGAVWDVAVDARVDSPTFGRHVALELSAENFRQLYVPAGMLHGFVVLSDHAQIEYKCTTVYNSGADLSVRWNDPELAIPWPVEDPILSDKDRDAPLLADVRSRLIPYRPV